MPLKSITRTVNTPIIKRNVSNSILRGIPNKFHSSKIRKYMEAHSDNPYVTADDITYDS